jgi:hypothetical protein
MPRVEIDSLVETVLGLFVVTSSLVNHAQEIISGWGKPVACEMLLTRFDCLIEPSVVGQFASFAEQSLRSAAMRRWILPQNAGLSAQSNRRSDGSFRYGRVVGDATG